MALGREISFIGKGGPSVYKAGPRGLENNLIVNAFKARVLAGGGTFEAYNCMSAQINHLLSLKQIVTTFNLRVLADLGTFEGVNCMQTQITNLQNININ
jgi:hypothetical protein